MLKELIGSLIGQGNGRNVQSSETGDTKKEIKEDLLDIQDSDELLEMLYDENSIENIMGRDLKSLEEYIEAKRHSDVNDYMYREPASSNAEDSYIIQSAVDPTRSVDAFSISGTGVVPPNDSDVNYRLVLRNSPSLKSEDVIAFLQAFQNEAQKRRTYIRCKMRLDQSDGIILYTDIENLLEAVKILEGLRNEQKYGNKVNNAIRNFGGPQPFSATLGDNPYYSIAMRGVEPSSSRIKSSLGGGLLKTFNQYVDEVLEFSYKRLLEKNGNDANKITAIELYEEMLAYHTQKMGVGEKIPLWMNNRIHKELKSKKYSL